LNSFVASLKCAKFIKGLLTEPAPRAPYEDTVAPIPELANAFMDQHGKNRNRAHRARNP